MKKNLILFILIYSTGIYSQKKNSITYIFPEIVEQKLYEQVEAINKIGTFCFEFYLESIDNGKFRISFSSFGNQSNNYWTDNTNRFVLINERKYPLIFDYDSLFSTSEPDSVGKYGHREGLILRSIFIYEGYNITFDKTGKSISESWGIYEKKHK